MSDANFISIIIATRHREKILWETVTKAVLAIQGAPAEIIVVNDGDEVLEVPGILADKVNYFNNPGYGVSAARNFGVSKALGNILFFLDDDMWIDGKAINWICAFVIAENLSGAAYSLNWEYSTELKKKLKKTKVGRYILDAKYDSLWGRLHKPSPAPSVGVYPYEAVGSGCLVISKRIFTAIGGYDERAVFQGEDADISRKLKSALVSIFIVFDVTLIHNHDDRLEVKKFLSRIHDGFASEYKAVKQGVPLPIAEKSYSGLAKIIFELSHKTEKGWILFLDLLPNTSILNSFTNRLIGALGGLQRYKQWKQNFD